MGLMRVVLVVIGLMCSRCHLCFSLVLSLSKTFLPLLFLLRSLFCFVVYLRHARSTPVLLPLHAYTVLRFHACHMHWSRLPLTSFIFVHQALPISPLLPHRARSPCQSPAVGIHHAMNGLYLHIHSSSLPASIGSLSPLQALLPARSSLACMPVAYVNFLWSNVPSASLSLP